MIKKEIKYNGITVFWSLVDGTNRLLLGQGLEDLGCAHLIPEPRNDSQALGRAIRTQFPSKRTLIRPLQGMTGYAVVHENPNGQEMEYEEEVRFGFINDELFSNPLDHPLRETIRQSYLVEKNLVTAAKLGGILVNACRELKGIPLRPRGGFYWIPEANKARWEQIVGVVEKSNIANTTYCMKTTTDKTTLDAVCDSLVAQVENKLSQLETDLEDGELGKRGLRTREKEAQELDDLVGTYEGILGKTLTSLRERAEEVESAASIAILEAMADF